EPTLFADRGFTAHEYLEDFKLYNMNGRLYDPVVGRFLSADPYVQDPGFTQSLNRYSYCLNNPLKYTDPSGEVIPWLYFAGQLLGNYLFGVADNTINKKMPLNQAAKQFNVGVSYNPSTNHFFIPGVDAQYTAWKQTAVTNTANELVSTRAIYGDEWHTAGQGGDLTTASFIAGAVSLGYDSWQNLAYDGYHYFPTKGPNAGKPTSVWKMNKSGDFALKNGSIIPNSANAASKLMVTSMVKIGGIALTTVGMGFTVYDIRQNGLNLSNGTDFVMGSVAYVPGWGWAVSGGYFIGKAAYEVYPSIPADYWGRPGTGFSK
ncbi:MAG: RHS repeat-associated core domain-containing protein, partial [Ignavibacteria bacterium]|nr:RHS repeat-associated core domain-containing protein [Ignavibacteria bacterium]